jgi:hypothetical protein
MGNIDIVEFMYEVEITNCEACKNGMGHLTTEWRTFIVRGTKIRAPYTYYKCDSCEGYTTNEMDAGTLEAIWDKYNNIKTKINKICHKLLQTLSSQTS